MRIIVFVFLLMLSIVFVGCDSGNYLEPFPNPDATNNGTTSTPPPTTTQQQVAPINFTGTAAKNTASFEAVNPSLLIEWSYTPDPQYPELALFGFDIYKVGSSSSVGPSVFTTGASGTSDDTVFYASQGQYYFDVSATNCSSWTITVTQ